MERRSLQPDMSGSAPLSAFSRMKNPCSLVIPLAAAGIEPLRAAWEK